MVELGIPLWQLQVVTSIGIIGVWIGWKGGMARRIGFYDLPTATRLLLYGFFAGALYQFLAASMVLDPIWAGTGLPIVEGFLLSLTFSLLTMFLLTRQGVRQLIDWKIGDDALKVPQYSSCLGGMLGNAHLFITHSTGDHRERPPAFAFFIHHKIPTVLGRNDPW